MITKIFWVYLIGGGSKNYVDIPCGKWMCASGLSLYKRVIDHGQSRQPRAYIEDTVSTIDLQEFLLFFA